MVSNGPGRINQAFSVRSSTWPKSQLRADWAYLGSAVEEIRRRGTPIDPAMLSRLSPLGWDRINLTGDYVWSDRLDLDANGLMPLLVKPLP